MGGGESCKRNGGELLMAEYVTTDTELTSVANAIRTKGGTSASLAYPTGFVSAIQALPEIQSSKSVTPTESAQTVSPDSGYGGIAQVNVGAISNTYVGTLVTRKAAQTYTPGTSDQTISANQYLTGAQTIKGDANLVAANIAKDVTIFGVTGTHEGGGGGAVTTVEFGDDSSFAGDHIDYVDGDGTHQSARSLANYSAATYQMLSGSLLVYISPVEPSAQVVNVPSTLTKVAEYTGGPPRSPVYIWVYQVA